MARTDGVEEEPRQRQQPAREHEQHEQEGEVGQLGQQAARQAGERIEHEAQEPGSQGTRHGEGGQHVVQPEIDEHGCRHGAHDAHQEAERVADALRPDDLEGLDLDRADPLAVAPRDASFERSENPPEPSSGHEKNGGGRERPLRAAEQHRGLSRVAIRAQRALDALDVDPGEQCQASTPSSRASASVTASRKLSPAVMLSTPSPGTALTASGAMARVARQLLDPARDAGGRVPRPGRRRPRAPGTASRRRGRRER